MQVLLCPEKSRPQENKDKVLLGYTAMVDAWAMGILAYELIVGKPPFEKQSRAATYEHIMYRKPEFPASMSADAKDFVFSALTKVCLSADKSCSTYMLGAPVLQAAQSIMLCHPSTELSVEPIEFESHAYIPTCICCQAQSFVAVWVCLQCQVFVTICTICG